MRFLWLSSVAGLGVAVGSRRSTVAVAMGILGRRGLVVLALAVSGRLGIVTAQHAYDLLAHRVTADRFPGGGLGAGEQGFAFAHGFGFRGECQRAATVFVAVVFHQGQARFHAGFGHFVEIYQMPGLRKHTAGADFVWVYVDHGQVVFIDFFPIGRGQPRLAEQPQTEQAFHTTDAFHACILPLKNSRRFNPDRRCAVPVFRRPQSARPGRQPKYTSAAAPG